MARKISFLVAVLVLPGGFIALFGAIAAYLLARSRRGRALLRRVRPHVPEALVRLAASIVSLAPAPPVGVGAAPGVVGVAASAG